MNHLANGINYFSMEGAPWLLVAWAGLVLLRPLAAFVHELGHGLAAYLVTRKFPEIRIGPISGKRIWKSDSLEVFLSPVPSSEGLTLYDEASLGKLAQATVLIMGPLSSLAMAFFISRQIILGIEEIWMEAVAVSWLCANLLAFLKSALPMKLKPTDAFPEGPPSDGLQLIRLAKGKDS